MSNTDLNERQYHNIYLTQLSSYDPLHSFIYIYNSRHKGNKKCKLKGPELAAPTTNTKKIVNQETNEVIRRRSVLIMNKREIIERNRIVSYREEVKGMLQIKNKLVEGVTERHRKIL